MAHGLTRQPGIDRITLTEMVKPLTLKCILTDIGSADLGASPAASGGRAPPPYKVLKEEITTLM